MAGTYYCCPALPNISPALETRVGFWTPSVPPQNRAGLGDTLPTGSLLCCRTCWTYDLRRGGVKRDWRVLYRPPSPTPTFVPHASHQLLLLLREESQNGGRSSQEDTWTRYGTQMSGTTSCDREKSNYLVLGWWLNLSPVASLISTSSSPLALSAYGSLLRGLRRKEEVWLMS